MKIDKSKNSVILESIFLLSDSDAKNSLSGIQNQDEIVSSNEIHITINKPRDEVFEYVLEPNNTPNWIDDAEIETVDTKQIGVNTIYKNGKGSWKVTDYERNVYFELTDVDDKYQNSYSFKKIDDDTTEIIYFECMLDASKLDEPFDAKHFEKLKELIEK